MTFIHHHSLFALYDAQFEDDLDHARSDMNACCVHLFGFFKAKWKLAEVRYGRSRKIGLTNLSDIVRDPKVTTTEEEQYEVTEEEQKKFDRLFEQLMDLCEMNEDFRTAARKLCTHESITSEDAERIRQYFHTKGINITALNFPLVS